MLYPLSLNSLPAHAPLWARLQPILQQGRIAHAFLLVGPRHASIMTFVNRLVATLLCQQLDAPCGSCQACRMFVQGAHPDVQYLRPEGDKGPIKIEQIRTLQQDVHQTPQCGARRFVILEPADKLNRAAANALLKLLEEPPEHTMFLLIAEQISNLPATIMSRCQQYVVPAPNELISNSHLALAQFYDESTDRAALFNQRFTVIELLSDMVAGKITPCAIAAQWPSYSLEDMVWFLYLLTADAIEYRLSGGSTTAEYSQLHAFAQKLAPEILFKQLDTMHALMKKMQQNITLNQTLALETILLGYLSC
ncbi:MAG: DNA polymerase III subunit delta' C-terminal domain-containing protein [Legionellaceae bacterium]|nr:DNA polymerase III subunit delta' C-terminal domain-containing protein [Legionellaceae bacterium]